MASTNQMQELYSPALAFSASAALPAIYVKNLWQSPLVHLKDHDVVCFEGKHDCSCGHLHLWQSSKACLVTQGARGCAMPGKASHATTRLISLASSHGHGMLYSARCLSTCMSQMDDVQIQWCPQYTYHHKASTFSCAEEACGHTGRALFHHALTKLSMPGVHPPCQPCKPHQPGAMAAQRSSKEGRNSHTAYANLQLIQ